MKHLQPWSPQTLKLQNIADVLAFWDSRSNGPAAAGAVRRVQPAAAALEVCTAQKSKKRKWSDFDNGNYVYLDVRSVGYLTSSKNMLNRVSYPTATLLGRSVGYLTSSGNMLNRVSYPTAVFYEHTLWVQLTPHAPTSNFGLLVSLLLYEYRYNSSSYFLRVLVFSSFSSFSFSLLNSLVCWLTYVLPSFSVPGNEFCDHGPRFC